MGGGGVGRKRGHLERVHWLNQGDRPNFYRSGLTKKLYRDLDQQIAA